MGLRHKRGGSEQYRSLKQVDRGEFGDMTEICLVISDRVPRIPSSMKKAFIDAAFAALECDNLLSLSSPGINSRRMQSGVEPPHSKALRASHIDCLPNESHSLSSEVVTSFSGLRPYCVYSNNEKK